MAFAGLLVALCFIASCQCTPLTWRMVSSADFTSFGSAFAYDNQSSLLLLFGGLGGSNGTYTWIYDTVAGGPWVPVDSSPEPPNRRYAYFGVVQVNGTSLFVVTHGIGSDEYGDTWALNITGQNWFQPAITGTPPSIRYGGHFGVTADVPNALWVGAGFTLITSIPSRYIDTFRLIFSSPTAAYWEEVHRQPSSGNQFNPLAPHGRCLQGSAVINREELIFWGGCLRGGNGGGPCPAEDGWHFDNANRKWTELPRCATPRVWSAMAPLSNDSGKAILYGGTDKFTEQIITDTPWPEEEVLLIDAETKEWTRYLVEASDEYPGRRYAHAMAAGPNGAVYMFGGRLLEDKSALSDLWILEGDPSQTRTTGCDRIWFSYAHLHGFFMAIAFGLLFPTGATIARFYRCKGRKIWFYMHVTIQLTAVLFTIPAFIMIFPTGASKEPTHPHAIIGIILMTIMFAQVINGILRPHIKEGKKKSKYRKCWEWFHRIWGVFTILLGLVQVSLGVFLIIPPLSVWVIWILILFGWVVAFIVNETIKCIRWLCFDSGSGGDEDFEMKEKHP